MKFTIRKKLSISFGIILLLMVLSSVITYSLLIKNENIQNQIINLRMQTVLLGKDVTIGINESLAALRGYMILGHDADKAEIMISSRLKAWNNLELAIAQYGELAKSWTVKANIQRLEHIKAELAHFKTAQQAIEDISHTVDNIESYKILLNEATPRAEKMLASITAIINEETYAKATPRRKSLLKTLGDVRGSFAIGLANMRSYLLTGDKEFQRNFKLKWHVNKQAVGEIDSGLNTLFSEIQASQWQSFVSMREEFDPISKQMFSLRSADDWNKANAWLGTKAAPRAAKILALLDEIKLSQEKRLANDINLAADMVQSLKTSMIVITLISLIIGIGSALLFSKDLMQRLAINLARAKQIATGDMTGQALAVKGNDELADLTSAINQMSDSLKSLVQQTASSMAEASEGSKEILSANHEMATGIKDQSSQIEQIASAIEELSNSSMEVSNNCNAASESSDNALILAQNGGKIVQKSLSHMVSIKQSFDNTTNAITSLSTQSKEIGDILSVIRGIADQTNLLALNAAIEAARAGEQGRGFAVVADEVRQLAARTTTATTEVDAAITSMHQNTDNAVKIIVEGEKKVTLGVDMSNEAASSLIDIISSVDDVAAKIQAISETAQQQTTTTAEIAENTESVSCVTRQVQAGVENVVVLSETVTQETSNRADKLLAMV